MEYNRESPEIYDWKSKWKLSKKKLQTDVLSACGVTVVPLYQKATSAKIAADCRVMRE